MADNTNAPGTVIFPYKIGLTMHKVAIYNPEVSAPCCCGFYVWTSVCGCHLQLWHFYCGATTGKNLTPEFCTSNPPTYTVTKYLVRFPCLTHRENKQLAPAQTQITNFNATTPQNNPRTPIELPATPIARRSEIPIACKSNPGSTSKFIGNSTSNPNTTATNSKTKGSNTYSNKITAATRPVLALDTKFAASMPQANAAGTAPRVLSPPRMLTPARPAPPPPAGASTATPTATATPTGMATGMRTGYQALQRQGTNPPVRGAAGGSENGNGNGNGNRCGYAGAGSGGGTAGRGGRGGYYQGGGQ